MSLKDILKKQGGAHLIKTYLKSGFLFTGVVEFFLLGRSRTALELLRLSSQLKIKQKLKKKYGKVLDAFSREYDSSLPHNTGNSVWVCWLQGLEAAPYVVKKCYESLQNNLYDKEVVLITEDNFNEFVTFPDFILEKWRKGIISNTHFTDLLRLELLINHGGTWFDATVFCSERRENISDFYFDSDLFIHQCMKPGRNGHSTYVSSWMITSKTNNRILMATREMLYCYWEKNNDMLDYFLLHNFLTVSMEYFEEDWKRIVPRDNSMPHVLLLRLFDRFDANVWDNIRSQCPFHKLSYKLDEKKIQDVGTYYDVLLNEKH